MKIVQPEDKRGLYI